MDIKPLILIVEDDKPIKKFMRVSLEAQGYKCIETEFGNVAIALIFSNNPDIIILDLGLPDIDGLNVIEKVRESTKARIIVVSARGHESEKVEALDSGADDYLTKPFSVAELLARIRVALRRFNGDSNSQNSVQSVFVVKDLKIDFEKRRVMILHEEIHLTPMEYKLIELMSRYAGRVLTHKYIIDEIWGSYFESETQSLRVFMANIRRKIEKKPAEPQYIITEVGVGYRLVDE
ncbi:response regulator [Clostridium sp. CF012]|uniref:response regulator n=1 Tax=Clostridium sp. CF012 TaxID=2843319 RepID=UPI001C0B0FC6|nr:response regulator transcription factor [Clostridium sp. CF012]MBU3146161.1 response regulator transcription factor [Clostridium sp. CF012]